MKRAFLTTAGVAIFLLMASSLLLAQSGSSELVGEWGVVGTGMAAMDTSGYGNAGTLLGDAAFAVDPQMGLSAYFFGPNGALLVPYSPLFTPAAGTVQTWVKTSGQQDSDLLTFTTDLLVRSNLAGSLTVYGLRVLKTGSIFGFIGNDDPSSGYWTSVQTRSNLVRPGEWHLVSLTWDGAMVRVFVDGQLQASQSYLPVPNLGLSYHGSAPLYVAVGTGWGDRKSHEFTGYLSRIQIYSGPLSPAAISRVFQATSPR